MMNYALPKADDVPTVELARTETPTPVNPLGVKGAGETGTIASTAAVANAVLDALAPFGSGTWTCHSHPAGCGKRFGRVAASSAQSVQVRCGFQAGG